MGTENDKFAVGDKNLGWLIVVDGRVESIDGIGQCGDVGFALLRIEQQ